jgi:serine/threonine-protein phosphatase PP1-1
MSERTIPQPGPSKLKRNAGPDEWLEAAKDCKFLSEHHMKQLCEIVKEYMMEGEDLYVFRRLSFAHQPQNQTSNQ